MNYIHTSKYERMLFQFSACSPTSHYDILVAIMQLVFQASFREHLTSALHCFLHCKSLFIQRYLL